MAKAKYIVTTKFVESNNAQRLYGENTSYDPATKTQTDGWVVVHDGIVYSENLASVLYQDETKKVPVGVAIRTFEKVS